MGKIGKITKSGEALNWATTNIAYSDKHHLYSNVIASLLVTLSCTILSRAPRSFIFLKALNAHVILDILKKVVDLGFIRISN